MIMLTFSQSIKICLSKYVDFKGRATRSEFWWWILFGFLVGIAANILSYLTWSFISTLVSLFLMLPNLSVGARRLHDTGHTGWLQGIPYVFMILAFVLLVAGIGSSSGTSVYIAMALALLFFVSLIYLIVLWCKGGTAGPNKYGHDPLDRPAFDNNYAENTSTGSSQGNDSTFTDGSVIDENSFRNPGDQK